MSGTHGVTLAMGWPREETEDLLGFAISRRIAGGDLVWLPVILQFEGREASQGALYPSNESPIQSMVWNDLGLFEDKKGRGLPADTELTYEVVPVRGTPETLSLVHADAVALTLRTEPQIAKEGASVFFNRGLSDAQEYERLFGEGHEPEGDADAMAWLARGLDEAIIDYIGEALEDPSLSLDAAVYHLDHQGVIDALAKLGKRCRVSMDWGDEEGELSGPYEGPNGPAYQQLIAAGVSVHQREHVAISHNKYMILKDGQGKAKAILTGSTNFTNGGISTQSNQSVILRDEAVASAYLGDFEKVLNNDNSGLRESNAKGTILSDSLEVYFSPHHSSDTPDLDRFTELATNAERSMLMLTFRMTSKEVLEAIVSRGNTLDDELLVFGVADRVYQGNDDSGDRLLYTEAEAGDPRVVSAGDPYDDIDDEPDEEVLYTELKREGFNPLVHHKILICDWDTPNCTVVTGSANYSNNSSKNNDENSLVIRGDQRLAEMYFVEFARLYTHWRARWLKERDYKHGHEEPTLASDASWALTWYAGGRDTELLRLALGPAVADRLAEPRPADKAAKKAALELAAPRMEHVVVLMLENRSFDHMLGFLPRVDGVLGKGGQVDPSRYNFADPVDPATNKYTVGKAEFFAIPAEDHKDEYGGPSHSYPAATEQLFGQKYRQASDAGSDPETNNGFIKSHIKELKFSQKIDDPKPSHIRVAIDAYSPQQLPTINSLAAEFCVCDRWFSEVPGPTEPNRLFTHAATSMGLTHNVWDHPITARTIQENLAEQGHGWRFYYQDLSDSNQFPALKSQPDNVRPLEHFYQDLERGGDLPAYSFLCPRYSDTDTQFADSQHAPYDVRYGEHLIADVYEAIRKSPNWEKTLLIVTYDEHGGFYDHVLPPSEGIANPEGLRSPTEYDAEQAKADPDKYGYLMKDDYKFSFQRLGFRVPTVLVSPWIARGVVDSTRYQHTSIAATLKEVYGLPSFLTRRDAQANTLTAALTQLAKPRADAPMKLPRPPLPGHEGEAPTPGQEPLGILQRGVYSTLAQLDGHADSGKAPPIPKTQAEASRYIEERYAAHNAFHRERKKGETFKSQDSRSLSTSAGQSRLAARYRLMQRGLVYPAPHARFVSYWVATGQTITRADVRDVMKSIRETIHARFGSRNTTAIVGVNFSLYRQWCKEDGGSVPTGMRSRFPDVFERSKGIFQNSDASLWFHIKSDEQSHLAAVHEAIDEALGERVDHSRTLYQDCNQRVRGKSDAGRVLGRRFAENLNNPTDPVTVAHHTLVGTEDVDHVGASYALAQRFLIDWERIHQMAEEQVEDIIGRTSHDEFLPSRDMRSHIKSARQQDRGGNTTFVMRLGLPFGTSPYAARPDLALAGNNKGDEQGIYFAGFAKRVDVFETIMNAQVGDTAGFMNDRLFNNLHSDLGGFFYIPSRLDLGLELDEWAEGGSGDWKRFPGVDWSRLSRHFTEKSPNGWMYYNHKNYLYEMTTMSADEQERKKPPSIRILTLLMDMFARWQDAWYFPKGQDEMDSLYDHIAKDPEFGAAKAKEVEALSIMERKGWATRMQCRLYASDAYGYRGRREIDGVKRSGADSYRIHPEEIIVGALPDMSLGQGRYCMTYLRQEEKEPAFFRGLSEASGVGHVLPDHQKLVNLGIGGLRAEIAEKAKAADASRRPFYAACQLSLQGVHDHLERYAELAESMAAQCSEGQAAERSNLEQIAARCRTLKTERPSTMAEAVQLIFTYHTCLHLNGEPVSIGRLDQYLAPFYEADIEAGRLDPEGAQEIIDALWVKLSEKILQNRIFIQDHQPYGNLAMGGGSGPYPQGASLGQWIMQVTVGGWVADENKQPTSAYNEVTRLCIRASGRLPLTAPCLSLRVHAETPRDLLEEAAQAILSGGAHPILLHDDKITAGLHQSGDAIGEGDPRNPSASTPVAEKAEGRWDSRVSLKSARNYASDGCYEPLFPGQTWFALGGFSSLNPLECALNQGRTYASAGETFLHGQNLSFRSKSAEEISTFDELLELYFTHFRLLWAKAFDGQISTFDALASICPAPLLSVLTDDCLAKGLDIYGGGARYNVYAPCWIGLSTTIDSLWAIKRMVFDEDASVTSLPELLDCLMCDWGHKMVEPMVSSLIGPNRRGAQAVRYQRLREIALEMPRYGEGDREIDEFGDQVAHRVATLCVDVLRNPAESTAKKMLDFANRHGTKEQPFGGFQIHPGTGTFENFSAFGVGSGASADGRRLNAPIASDMSPTPGRSDAPANPVRVPFDAALASSKGEGTAAFWDGAPTDFNIDESFPLETLADMLGQFAAGQGSNILTVSVASPETFAQAPDRPEAYDLLRVRMGGWSEYFTSMFPTSQVQHQRRPLMTPPEGNATEES